MKNINKESDEEIRQDFENELRDVDFDSKKLIINNDIFKEALSQEFSDLVAEPKLLLYLRDFITDEEWAKDFQNRRLSTSNLEIKHHSLENSFFELVTTKKLQSKYYGRSIENTNTVKALEQIKIKVEDLKNYIFLNTSVQEYGSFAKVVAEAVMNEANKLPIIELRKEIIQDIIADNDNSFIIVKYLYSNSSDTEKSSCVQRYGIIKTYFNSFLTVKLQEIVDLEKDCGDSRLTVSSAGYISYNGFDVKCNFEKGQMFEWFLTNAYELLAKHLYIQKLQAIFNNEEAGNIKNLYFVAHGILETSIQQIRVEVSYNEAKKQNLVDRNKDLIQWLDGYVKQLLHDKHKTGEEMTQAEYIDIVMNGYINNKEYLPEYYLRECKKAERNYIDYKEFFSRLADAINMFYRAIETSCNEANDNYKLAKSQMKNTGEWKEEFEQANRPITDFSAHLLSLTAGKYTGHLWTNDIRSMYDAYKAALAKYISESTTIVEGTKDIPLIKGPEKWNNSTYLLYYYHIAKSEGRELTESKVEQIASDHNLTHGKVRAKFTDMLNNGFTFKDHTNSKTQFRKDYELILPRLKETYPTAYESAATQYEILTTAHNTPQK